VFVLHHIKKKFGANLIGFCKQRESIVMTYPPKNLQKFLAQREKWASKTPAYQDRFSLFTAGLIFSYALFTVICAIGSFFSLELLYILIILYGVKMLSDFFLLWDFSRFVNDKSMMKIYPVVQLIYPFYIIFSAFAALVYKKRTFATLTKK
jgi:cellulose synthase/poly-beta-1,6-N-acetylglucosamine synthase-like glycosyltransferase